MDKLKLKWKIFGFLLGFSTLLLAILWMFQTVFLSDMYKYTRKVEIKKAIKLIEENIDNPNLKDILSELEITKEIVVMPTKDFAPPVRPFPNRHNPKEPETITKERKFTTKDGSEISLTFHAMISPVDATVSTLQMQLIIITIIMIILTTLLAIIISKHISNPIEQINKSAKKLAKGKYDTEFNGRGFLEIKELSDTLNTASYELSKVERLRRELMANISHDLRTPLALIYSYAEMMHDFPDEVTREQSQIIMDEAKRLTSLVNDILDISSLETGMTKLNKTRYNLTESLQNTIKRLNELVKNQGYQLSFDYNEDVYIRADEVKITQAFYNLLLNAITYSGTDRTVIIRQSMQGNMVRIEVFDHGEGIREHDLPYVWDRYYKIDKKHKRPIMGTGLGLSIVKKVVELHKGEYGAASDEGKGSVFWFQLHL